jgi:hypothetical protein
MQRAHIKAAEHQGAADRTAVVPHFINEDKSDMRGIKSGWYAMDNAGKLVFGPFATCEKCGGMIAEGAYKRRTPSAGTGRTIDGGA